MNVELLCRRALEALVNGGYQGFLLTVVVLAALFMMRRSTAATRHNICLFTLLLVALLPAVHFARSTSMFEWFVRPTAKNTGVRELQTAATGPIEEQKVPASSREATAENFEVLVSGSVYSGVDRIALPSGSAGERATDLLAEKGEPAGSKWNVALPFSSTQCVTVVAGVAALSLIRLAMLAWQLFGLRALKRKAEKAPDHLQERFRALWTEMGPGRRVALLIGQNEGPCAIGFWHPRVIVPRSMMGTERVEAILRHELAHIDRGDDWASLFQQLVNAFLFFHPAVWLLSRWLSMEREIACDDHVLAARPNRRDYALLLTEFAGQSGVSRMKGMTAAPAAWGRKTQLKRRIDMILNKNRNSSPRTSRRSVGMMGAAAALAAVLGIGFGPQIAVAQSAADPASPAEEIEDVTPPRAGVAVAAPVPALPRRPRVAVAAVVPAAPGVVPYIAAEPPDALEPVRPNTPRKARARADGSVDERLDRLERMLEELVAREKGGNGAGVYGKGPAFQDWQGYKHDAKEFERMQKEMERANKEIERAAKDAARSLQEAQKNWNVDGFQNFHQFHQFGDFKNPKAQRKALEAQRKALEKQLQAIEQRLDALQDEEEEFDEKVQEKEDRIKEKLKDKQNKPLEKEKTELPADAAPKR